MADHPTQSFHISPHTVLFDLKRSSSPLSIIACFDLDEPSRSDDRLMVGREGSKRRKCGTQSRTLSDRLVIGAHDNETGGVKTKGLRTSTQGVTSTDITMLSNWIRYMRPKRVSRMCQRTLRASDNV